MRSSSEIQAELNTVNAEVGRLIDESRQHDARQKQIRDRLDELGYGASNTGAIPRLEKELARAKAREEDDAKPRVVWEIPLTSHTYIVEKLTPNRIYVKILGGDRLHEFNKFGQPLAEFERARINIPQTMVSVALAALGPES